MGEGPEVDRRVRPATVEDEPFLWTMLRLASHSPDGTTVDAMRADPALARYVEGWGRPGDLGVIAAVDGDDAGAAWLRLVVGDEQRSPAFVDAATPEIAIAVRPGGEGRGVGTAMLRSLLAAADPVHAATTLNVRADNPARRLYERAGFVAVREIVNRVGTESIVMVRSAAGG